jgi:putative CocE/NonD family hydrolase
MTTSVEIQVQADVAARMRDGVVLRADVYRPADSGTYPVLLTRTPYDKTFEPSAIESARALAEHGYIAVVQDVRGRWASEGAYRPLDDDIDDGFDSVLWAAALDGSSGAVGMFGSRSKSDRTCSATRRPRWCATWR